MDGLEEEMTRIVKFRAWHKGIPGKHGIPAQMLYDEKPGDCLVWKNQGQNIEDVMQFTGLLDRNGKEIYEGDIIRFTQHLFNTDWAPTKQGIVGFDRGQFTLEHAYIYGTAAGRSDFEIIGNLYENPELVQP